MRRSLRIAARLGLAAAIAACIPVPTPAPTTGPATYGAGPATAAVDTPTATASPAAASSAAAASPSTPAATPRNVRFNRATLDARGLQTLAQLEAYFGTRLPDGDYWYDATSGAAGPQGGPVAVVLLPGLPLGGPLRADASGGGDGRLTGVFVNGRELHPQDVANLSRFMQVMPGRWWVDAQGNGGQEGGPPLFNLYALARAAAPTSRSHSVNGDTWVGPGMATTSWKSDSGRIKNDCSFDPSDGGMLCSKTSN